jgi:NADH dehydrogenase [ubiquinone] 1 alpha subcomplex assembly factor 7
VPNAPLKGILMDRIKRDGPIDLATYMQEALAHPEHGYYTTRQAIGSGGDFTTAPEVSQLFGELIGLWIVDCWQQMGSPTPINLIEPGPGRGTLMFDAIRAIHRVSTMAPNVHLVETSPRLIAMQQEKLEATWHHTIDTVPQGPFILVANEFFDALPIHQFEKTAKGWTQAVVDASPSGNALKRGLRPCDTPTLTAPPDEFDQAPEGAIVESCPDAESFTTSITERLQRDIGTALFIDYGYATPAFGDSLQALYEGAYADPFAQPGHADLTSHVNFSALATIAKEANIDVHGPVEQGFFLDQLGIQIRAQALKRSANADQSREVDMAVERLTAPVQMGTLFKMFAISSAPEFQPAGFAA